ncbi:hypothetical protein HRbin17_00871 [bacterium HR17]|uniref:DUF2007 domain-containing protein n=1 Tax=Candidatus Fervidibacter japonicus TaxID=2035412 RepID=A0A2H5XB01_9BACT|nr:hypothetical protein HRbin17_00871 [bacterium HR17]
MSEWMVVLTGLPSEIAAAQSWLNANGVPTFVRDADPYTGTKSLLVPASQLDRARKLLQALLTADWDGGETGGEAEQE